MVIFLYNLDIFVWIPYDYLANSVFTLDPINHIIKGLGIKISRTLLHIQTCPTIDKCLEIFKGHKSSSPIFFQFWQNFTCIKMHGLSLSRSFISDAFFANPAFPFTSQYANLYCKLFSETFWDATRYYHHFNKAGKLSHKGDLAYIQNSKNTEDLLSKEYTTTPL